MMANVIVPEADLRSHLFVCSLMANGCIWIRTLISASGREHNDDRAFLQCVHACVCVISVLNVTFISSLTRATCSINTKLCVGESRNMHLNSTEYNEGLNTLCVCVCAQVNACLYAPAHEHVNCAHDRGKLIERMKVVVVCVCVSEPPLSTQVALPAPCFAPQWTGAAFVYFYMRMAKQNKNGWSGYI